MTQLASSLDTTQPYIPLHPAGALGKLVGVPKYFSTLAALNAAVTAENANIAAGSSLWADGEPLAVVKGSTYTWNASAGTVTVVAPPSGTVTNLQGIPGFNAFNRIATAPVHADSDIADPYYTAFAAAGSAITVATRPADESGIVSELQMSGGGDPAFWDLRLQAFWDGATLPDIDVDLGTLFAAHGDAHTGAGQSASTDHIGMTVVGTNVEGGGVGGAPNSGSFALRMPMAYGNGYVIKIATPAGVTPNGSGSIFFRHLWRNDVTSKWRLRSASQTRLQAAALTSYAAASDIPFFDLTNISGVLLYMGLFVFGSTNSGTGGYSYLERPYLFYRDGESTPSYRITGGEEHSENGYYFGFSTRSITDHVLMTASNNSNLTTTLGVDWLKHHGGITFSNRLKAVWTNKAAPFVSTTNIKLAYCFLYLVDTTVPFAPSAARNVASSAGTGTMAVTWGQPASFGSQPITGVRCVLSPSGMDSGLLAATVVAANFTGLANGTAQTPTITYYNSIGSTPIAGPAATPAASSVPGAPTAVTATAGNGQLTASCAAPANNGGSTITGYLYTTTPGGFTGSSAGATPTPVTISGLANGTAYTVTAHAINANGAGAESAASAAVTPAAGNTLHASFATVSASGWGSADTGQTFGYAQTGGAAAAAIDAGGATIDTGLGSTNTGIVFVDVGTTAQDAYTTLAAIGANPGFPGLILRYVDANNYIVLQYDAADNTATRYALYAKIAGNFTLLGASTGITPTVNDVLRATVAAGALAVTFKVNGTSFGPFTATGASATSTKIALCAGSSYTTAVQRSTARFKPLDVV